MALTIDADGKGLGMKGRVHRVLVTQPLSEIGQALLRLKWPPGLAPYAPAADELDLSDPAQLAFKVECGARGEPWAAVINTASFEPTAMAKGDEVMAWLVNTLAPVALGEACFRVSAPLVHIASQRLVFAPAVAPPGRDTELELHVSYHESKAAAELAFGRQSNGCVVIKTGVVAGRALMDRIADAANELRHDRSAATTIPIDSATDIAENALRVVLGQLVNRDAPTGVISQPIGKVPTFQEVNRCIWRCKSLGIDPSPVREISNVHYMEFLDDENVNEFNDDLGSYYGMSARGWRAAVREVFEERA